MSDRKVPLDAEAAALTQTAIPLGARRRSATGSPANAIWERRDTQTARRQARRAQYTGFVSRETDRHRAEIPERQVQSAAAIRARGLAASGRAMVGGAQRGGGDVGAAQVWREISHTDQ